VYVCVCAEHRLGVSPTDPLWVGAWWLGFLVSLVLVVLTIIPITCFPANPPSKYIVNVFRVFFLDNIRIVATIGFIHPKPPISNAGRLDVDTSTNR